MQFTINQLTGRIIGGFFSQQMTPIGGRIYHYVFRVGKHAAFQHAFQRFVSGIVVLERQVIAKNDEVVGLRGQLFDHLGQISKSVFADLDKPQTLLRMSIEHAMHQGGLTRTSGTPEQSVIRRQTRQQLPGILNQ